MISDDAEDDGQQCADYDVLRIMDSEQDPAERHVASA